MVKWIIGDELFAYFSLVSPSQSRGKVWGLGFTGRAWELGSKGMEHEMIAKKLSEANQMDKGLLMVLSGNAEDKAVSAFGQVFRALGQGIKVCVIEFSSDSWISRSDLSERFQDLLTVHALGNNMEGELENPTSDQENAQKAWKLAKETINSGRFQMVVLNEFVDLLIHKAIDGREAVDFLSKRPADVHVIITGSDPPQLLVDAADLVTAINRLQR
jgi:cob(I)alamin adenosyltransferase